MGVPLFLRRAIFILTLVFSALLPLACSNSPTQPTHSSGPTGPIIVAAINLNAGAFLQKAEVFVADSTGTTGTANTGVTIISSGVTIPLPYVGLTNDSPSTIEGAPYVTGSDYSASITYTAGQVYTFNVVMGGTTYSAAATGISGSPAVQPSGGSAGVTCSWTGGIGNKNYISVQGALPGTYIGPPLSSNPYVVPNSVFSNETPGAGSDAVNLSVVQFFSSAFPGAQSSSCVSSRNVASVNY